MILFTIFTIIMILLIAFILFVVTTGGAAFAIIFGDVIVCIVLIGFVLKLILKHRK